MKQMRAEPSWEEPQRVLGEQTLDDLEADAARARREADSRAAAADQERLTRALAQPLEDAELAALRGRTSAARRAEGGESSAHARSGRQAFRGRHT